jgi:hypothetical protein
MRNLAFTVLLAFLLGTSPATGDPVQTPSGALPPVAVESALSALALPFCLEDAPPLAGSTQQDFPAWRLGFTFPRCGSCSLDGCSGARLFAACGGTNGSLACVDIGTCPADGSYQCACRTPQ